MTDKKCGQCDNLARIKRFKTLGACMVRKVGMDGLMPRHIGDRACPAFKEKE